MSTSVILAIVAGLAGALGAYLIALRKLSGTVRHSEAEQLWAESKSIRTDLQRRNEYLNTRIDRAEARIAELEAQLDLAHEKHAALVRENLDLRSRLK